MQRVKSEKKNPEKNVREIQNKTTVHVRANGKENRLSSNYAIRGWSFQQLRQLQDWPMIKHISFVRLRICQASNGIGHICKHRDNFGVKKNISEHINNLFNVNATISGN